MRLPCLALGLSSAMMLAAGTVHAGLSGRLEVLFDADNRPFRSSTGIEEWLDLAYDDPKRSLHGGVSAALSQREGEGQLYQLYLEKTLDNRGDEIRLGRFLRADSIGFYSLDGFQLKHSIRWVIFAIYAGVPRRIEAFRSVDADAIYGVDLRSQAREVGRYSVDGWVGWQRFEQDEYVDRFHLGLRGAGKSSDKGMYPSAFSMSGSYVADESWWEAAQVNTRWDLENTAHLRLDYEIYEPATEKLSFRDRFYSLYARGRQSQLKVAYQFRHGQERTWSLIARRVVREFGGAGYSGVVGFSQHNLNRTGNGWLLSAQAERLELVEDRSTSLYFEGEKPLSSTLSAGISGVLQYQEKQLTGDNRAAGIELRLERMVKVESLPSGLYFSGEASHIWNSRLENEYRLGLRVSYHFDDRVREALQ